MTMRLYLDDIRHTPAHVWYDMDLPYTHSPKTAGEAIALLETGEVEFISFDHDLGPAEAGTGHDVALWIERAVVERPGFRVPDWAVHSANPVGAGNIQRTMLNAVRLEAVR